MLAFLRDVWIWAAIIVLIVLWLPLLAIVRLCDRDPALYSTGRWFRRLGAAMTRVNPAWKITIRGLPRQYERKAVVVVSNHQSLADIPVLSRLPWEMKWVAKRELFRLPIVGWMMRLAGDISLERGDARSGARVLVHAGRYLKNNCPVIIFPEGTRSPDGLVGNFTDGAFHLAIAAQVPILPVSVEGTSNALPKTSWRFRNTARILVTVFPEVSTAGLNREDVPALREKIRAIICESIAASRGVPQASVDAASRLRGGQRS
jgi:1-acyl-sn-glycerol-3-phosphate acyltransferase